MILPRPSEPCNIKAGFEILKFHLSLVLLNAIHRKRSAIACISWQEDWHEAKSPTNHLVQVENKENTASAIWICHNHENVRSFLRLTDSPCLDRSQHNWKHLPITYSPSNQWNEDRRKRKVLTCSLSSEFAIMMFCFEQLDHSSDRPATGTPRV